MNWIIIGVIFILSHLSNENNGISIITGQHRRRGAVLATPLPQGPSASLNPFIRHWEPAIFDRTILDLAGHHHTEYAKRRKRSIPSHTTSVDEHGPANTIRLEFAAHDRNFKVHLKQNPSTVFASDVQLEGTDGPIDYDTTRVYSGGLEDDDNSHVHGVLTVDNLFDGTIYTNLETYYIEPANKYTNELDGRGWHTVIYKSSDVNHPALGNSAEHCASERLRRRSVSKTVKVRTKRWLPEEELYDSRNPPLPLDLDVPYNDDVNVYNVPSSRPPVKAEQTINRKSIIVNDFSPNSEYGLRNSFTHRNIIVSNYDNNSIKVINNNSSRPSHKTHVEIITKNGATKKPNIIGNNYNPDVMLTGNNYHHPPQHHQPHTINLNVRNEIGGDEDGAPHKTSYDRKSTCMLYLQADHTFFQKMGSDEASIEAITRHVQRANVIYKNTDFNGDGKPDNITFMIKRVKVHNMNALKDSMYRFPGNYGVEKFLELFSEEDYDAFCLAYMFTYRDFEMGTLGLAWTGDLKNAGGVCEKNGHYRGSLKSLNTGIVTLLNYGKHVPPAVSHVTLAHEIGHNFGSPHDPEQCTPGGEDGNYIMFARATSGDKRNNNKFSPCSLKAIEPVLNAKARSAKGCFTEPQQAICGNGVVEPGEQCDCGWEEDCQDSCCYPMSRHARIDEKPCTLTPRASCSPSQGPCCTADCALKFGNKCRDDNGCRDPSFCDGRMPQCPPSINKPNKTICNKEFVCYMGECTGSICLAYGLESCQCIPGPNDPKTKSCELCCKIPGEGNVCKSSFEWNESPYDVPDMFAKPGTPCNDYNGYCDVFQKCREVDPSGPLATLRKLLLSEESIASFRKWMQSNWYTVTLIVVGVLLLLVLSTKLLGKRNLKQKSVTIIHSATTETVRLPDDNNGVIVHTAVRTKVPFKKKVRGERAKSKTTTAGKIQSATTAAANKVVKRQTNKTDSPKKLIKKKKRVSAPVGAEEQQQQQQQQQQQMQPQSSSKPLVTPVSKSSKLKSSKHKEIIDYSRGGEGHTNTFGKVQKWLLESPIVSQPLSQFEHSSKVQNIMNKSQSTPERLGQRSPKKIGSVGNLNEKVKLQVVYKPPFKFSLKLSKNSSVKTKVIGAGIGKSKRKLRTTDRNRVGALPSSSKRTALLVRTTTSDDPPILCNEELAHSQEPAYETLDHRKSSEAPVYENVNMTEAIKKAQAAAFDNNTFRIAKANTSGQTDKLQLLGSNLQSSKYPVSTNEQLAAVATKDHTNSRISNNLSKQFGGSSQNLKRASTTNLSKNRSSFDTKRSHELSRSSTTNLTKEHRYGGSNQNLRRGSSHSNLTHDEQQLMSGSRKNSTSSRKVKNTGENMPRVPSNSNLSKQSTTSLRRGSINNIPRASLTSKPMSINFNRQTSLQGKPRGPTMGNMPLSAGVHRPHNTSCAADESMQRFEWPNTLLADRRCNDDPLPSDLEVMCSDVENLVND